MDDRYFDDYTAGAVYEHGSVAVTEEEIIGFASQYDPQSFHVDPVAAQQGPFGGLVASGWHTVALMMQLFARHYLSAVASLGSLGVDELHWLKPVRPDDKLRLRPSHRRQDPPLGEGEQGRVVLHPDLRFVGEPDRSPLRTAAAVHHRQLQPPQPHRADPGSARLPAVAKCQCPPPRCAGRPTPRARPYARREGHPLGS
ncbi:acyl dehydratase [Streptomyces sp. GS7]|nr:acyl dehydratase [Streptomyces sp. GS7]